jgi:hypothetical protein
MGNYLKLIVTVHVPTLQIAPKTKVTVEEAALPLRNLKYHAFISASTFAVLRNSGFPQSLQIDASLESDHDRFHPHSSQFTIPYS